MCWRSGSNWVVCIIVFLFASSSCKKTPSEVLDHEEMAQLMADIHTGEGVINLNYATFPNDSTRKILKQSIYSYHGVTAEQVDTSYIWYGNHIEEYIKVYDRVIEILQERQRNLATATSTQIAIAGDSVDVWPGPRHIEVSHNMPMKILSFALPADSNWHKGDVYTLQYKAINNQSSILSRILVDYSDGSTGYADNNGSNQGWTKIKLQLDTTVTPIKVYGYLMVCPENRERFHIDSIALTRVRRELISNNTYYYQARFNYGKRNNGAQDSMPANATSHKQPQTFGEFQRATNVQNAIAR